MRPVPFAPRGTRSGRPARARAVEREAVLDRGQGSLAVRVWYDDGRVATTVVEAP